VSASSVPRDRIGSNSVVDPWQRGTNENTNRLLRQYFPKGTSLSGYSHSDLNKIALRLTQRPRKTLGFQTPAAKLNVVLQ
jgi:IS30 family transposase